jgi:hypothetical protein
MRMRFMKVLTPARVDGFRPNRPARNPQASWLTLLGGFLGRTIRSWNRWIEDQTPVIESWVPCRCRGGCANRLPLKGPWHKGLYNSRTSRQAWPLQLLAVCLSFSPSASICSSADSENSPCTVGAATGCSTTSGSTAGFSTTVLPAFDWALAGCMARRPVGIARRTRPSALKSVLQTIRRLVLRAILIRNFRKRAWGQNPRLAQRATRARSGLQHHGALPP